MEPDINSITVNIEKVLETKCLHCHKVVDVGDLAVFDEVECPHCGKSMSVPGKLGNFTLLNEVGKGGMGSVYRARDEGLGRLVAVKVILPSLAADKDFIDTFKHEAQAAAKVNHSHIAQIYSFGEEHGQPYIVMELVTGRGLDQLIDSGKTLDEGLIIQIGMDIAEGLEEADTMGLIHGDIKPENILLDEKMQGKLIDFGIASVGGVDAADGIWGTPYYIAPEKLRREKVDARSDIYCLGATLYHALAGAPPFDGDTPAEVVKARLEYEPLPLRMVRDDISEDVERIIIRMLKTEPAQRYPNYSSLLSDMRKVAKTLKPSRNPSVKSKKIVMRKRGAVVKPSNTAVVGTTKPMMVPSKKKKLMNSSAMSGKRVEINPKSMKSRVASQPKQLTPEQVNKKKQHVVRVMWTVISLVIVSIIVTAVIIFKVQEEKDVQKRRAWIALNSAITTIEGYDAKIALSVSNIVKQAEVTKQSKDNVVAMASVVTKRTAEDLLVSLAPPAPAKPEFLDAQGGDTNAPADAVKAPSKAAPAKVKKKRAPVEEGPPPVREEGPPPVREEGPPPVAGDEPEPKIIEEAPKVEEPVPEPVVDDPPIIALAKKAFIEITEIENMVDAAVELELEAEELIEPAVNSRIHAGIAAIFPKVEEQLEQLGDISSNIDKSQKKLNSITSQMETISRKFEKQRAEALLVKLEAEKVRRKEVERQRLLALHEAAVANDLSRIDNVSAALKAAMDVLMYDDIVYDLKKRRKNLQTDEGKAAMDIYIDRAVYMQNLKKFIIKQLNIAPYQWGWIADGSQEDIFKASKRNITLKGRSVKWTDVSAKQFLHLIKHYVNDLNKDVKLVELGSQFMAVAVYYYAHDAYEPASRYANQAIEFNPRLSKDKERLFPEPVAEENFDDEF
ncbi:MAG: protein kinase [Kiritimatiellae bacterium]|nr:protein kinase [Kiritimatiellia bacterium]